MARAITASAPAATSAQSDSAASSEEAFSVTRYSAIAAFHRCSDRANDARPVVRAREILHENAFAQAADRSRFAGARSALALRTRWHRPRLRCGLRSTSH